MLVWAGYVEAWYVWAVVLMVVLPPMHHILPSYVLVFHATPALGNPLPPAHATRCTRHLWDEGALTVVCTRMHASTATRHHVATPTFLNTLNTSRPLHALHPLCQRLIDPEAQLAWNPLA